MKFRANSNWNKEMVKDTLIDAILTKISSFDTY